jgi:hypothetical protein
LADLEFGFGFGFGFGFHFGFVPSHFQALSEHLAGPLCVPWAECGGALVPLANLIAIVPHEVTLRVMRGIALGFFFRSKLV